MIRFHFNMIIPFAFRESIFSIIYILCIVLT